MKLSGVWLPIVTPFYNDEIDYEAYADLIEYYIPKGISGLIPLGTTGESSTINETEYERLIDRTMEVVDGRIPVFAGAGGNDTAKVIKIIKKAEKYGVDGVLSVCPYYNRPAQNGLYQHFLKISEATDLKIIIYNIPYRTGVNLGNDILFKLANQRNIIGIKDSCGQLKQTLALLGNKPEGFSVLTGEDILFYTTLVNGGDGGILAAAHLQTEYFVEVYRLLTTNDHQEALKLWRELEGFIPLLFEEPNPAPVKYCLQQRNLIRSDALRLPLTQVSGRLKQKLDARVLHEDRLTSDEMN